MSMKWLLLFFNAFKKKTAFYVLKVRYCIFKNASICHLRVQKFWCSTRCVDSLAGFLDELVLLLPSVSVDDLRSKGRSFDVHSYRNAALQGDSARRIKVVMAHCSEVEISKLEDSLHFCSDHDFLLDWY
jgi:hypothetical protein